MSDHARQANTARRLIAKHGRTVQLISVRSYNSDYKPDLVESSTPVVALQTQYRTAEIDDTTIKSNDKKYLLDSDVAPTVNGFIFDKGRKYTIINIDEIAPGDQVMLYKVQAR